MDERLNPTAPFPGTHTANGCLYQSMKEPKADRFPVTAFGLMAKRQRSIRWRDMQKASETRLRHDRLQAPSRPARLDNDRTRTRRIGRCALNDA